MTLLSGLFFMSVANGYTGVKPDGELHQLAVFGTLAINGLVGVHLLSIFLRRVWAEFMGTRRKPPLPGQDPDDVKALAKVRERATALSLRPCCRSVKD